MNIYQKLRYEGRYIRHLLLSRDVWSRKIVIIAFLADSWGLNRIVLKFVNTPFMDKSLLALIQQP